MQMGKMRRSSVSKLMSFFGVLVCLTALTLKAQGYDTKFKAVGFKPGDAYHTDENVSVSLNGGGLEVSIPLGPAIPGPIPLRPVINYHGKLTQALNRHQPNAPIGLDQNSYMRWVPPALPSSSIHPGKLYLTRSSDGMYGDDAGSSLVSITGPSGQRSEYFEGSDAGLKVYSPANPADVQELTTLQQNLVTQAEWPYRSTWGTTGSGLIAYRTTDHSTLIFGPADHKIFYSWDYYTNGDGTRRDQYTYLPTQILQITAQEIILWQQSRNVYKPVRNEQTTVAEQWWWRGTVYHPVWIKTRSGFKVNVSVTRGVPKERTDLVDRGLLQSWTVSYATPTGQTVGYTVNSLSASPVTFQGMAGYPAPSGISLSGATPARVTINSPGWQPNTTLGYETLGSERQYDVDCLSDELAVGFTTLTQGSLTTAVEYNGPGGLMSKLTNPRGKVYQFTYDMRQGVGLTPPSAGKPGDWYYDSVAGNMDYWSVVTRMDVSDTMTTAGSGTRSTSYQWAIPIPQILQSSPPYPWNWSAKRSGVAQTLPDGQTVLHVFASPLDSAVAGAPVLDYAARTFMAQRQTVVARYTFPAGDTSWQGFFASDAFNSGSANWHKRELMEGWDLRAWNQTLPAVTPNQEPRATRVISQTLGGPVTVVESDDWDPANNQFRTKRTYQMPSGSSPATQFWAPGLFADLPGAATYQPAPGLSEAGISGALAHAVQATTFASPAEGLYARPSLIQGRQVIAPASGAAGYLPGEQFTYDSAPGRAHVVVQKDQLASDGSPGRISLAYTATPEGLFTVDRLKSVQVSGTAWNQAVTGNLSGLVGASYAYGGGTVDGIADSSGRFMTQIQPMGVTWNERELAHDGLGRPLSQTDPNGFTPSIGWDTLGRLTTVSPPNGEIGTTISYPVFNTQNLRQATVVRGVTTNRYYYNAFGELIGEDRLGIGSAYSHRSYAYDNGGRKVFESIWRPGAFTATQASDWTMPGVETTAAGWTEQVCTATIYDPDLGQRVCVQWSTVYHPATTVTIAGTSYAYDTRGRLIRTTNPNGEITENRYDISGNALVTQKVTAPGTTKQAITTFERDVLGRLAKVTDPMNPGTAYAYDAAGRVQRVQQSDPAGHTQTRGWVYDGLGRLVVLDQPESGVTYYTSFTVTGKPRETVYGLPGGWRPADVNARDASAFTVQGVKVLTSVFDTLGRPTSVTGPGVNQAFIYDTAVNGKGKLTSATSEGTTRTLEYLALNGRQSKLTRSVDGLSFVQTLGYDNYGKITSRGYPGHTNPAVVGTTQNLVYDDIRSLPNSTALGGVSLLTLGYDATSWAPIQMSWANGAASSFTYRTDQTGLASMTHTIPGQTGASWVYSYDALGLLTTDGADYYTYDPLGRLLSAFVRDSWNTSTNQGLLQQFSYDAFGNRSSVSSQVVVNWTAGTLPPAAPTTTSITDARLKDVQTYGFNTAGSALWGHNQLPAATLVGASTGAIYDGQGNLTNIYRYLGDATSQLTFGYDALGRVTSLGDSKNATSQTYGYDDEGLRLKLVDSRTGITTYNLYNEARQLAATFTKSGSTLTWKRDIFYVGTKEVAEVDSIGTKVTLVDHLGSPRFAWRGSGAPVKQKFMPFGEALADTTSASQFGKGFTNHEQTDPSGLIYMQARFYAPWYGRFLSPDPARDQHFEETQSWNIYSYVQNNPTMLIDPTGMFWDELKNFVKGNGWNATKGAAVSVGAQAGNDAAVRANYKATVSALKKTDGAARNTAVTEARAVSSPTGRQIAEAIKPTETLGQKVGGTANKTNAAVDGAVEQAGRAAPTLLAAGAAVSVYNVATAPEGEKFRAAAGESSAWLGALSYGGMAGAGGAKIGAVIGTFIEPGGGTALGAAIGGFIGSVGGGIYGAIQGKQAGEALYDAVNK